MDLLSSPASYGDEYGGWDGWAKCVCSYRPSRERPSLVLSALVPIPAPAPALFPPSTLQLNSCVNLPVACMKLTMGMAFLALLISFVYSLFAGLFPAMRGHLSCA